MSSATAGEDGEFKTIRVLALHGSEGTAEEFPSRLEAIKETLEKQHNARLDITTVEGPFPKGQGFSWWTMQDGERSFTAETYGGFEESSKKVLDAWAEGTHLKPFDLILGHSQGAIMIASLLAIQKAPYHPTAGYVFNGVSFPNPYRDEISNLKIADGDALSAPRILFVMGTNDKITPNDTGLELMEAFRECGLGVDLVKHPGGHGVPKSLDSTVDAIAEWMAK